MALLSPQAEFAFSVSSGLTTALMVYIAATLKKGWRKFKREHEWLMTTVETNTAAILELLEERDANAAKSVHRAGQRQRPGTRPRSS